MATSTPTPPHPIFATFGQIPDFMEKNENEPSFLELLENLIANTVVMQEKGKDALQRILVSKCEKWDIRMSKTCLHA